MSNATSARRITFNDDDLMKDRKGRATWCMENACLMLERHPDWAGVLAFDEFSVMDLVLRPVPGTSSPRSSFNARELKDTDVTDTMRWFNRNGFQNATRTIVYDAIIAVARHTIVSPVTEYLRGLEWDGTHRIDTWLQSYCESPDDALSRRFGRLWLIAAVARALNPGCKADNALVLEGPQGAGKSSVLRALAGEQWFFDGLRDMHSKDASVALRGKWIVELSELSALRRSEIEATKAYLSRTEERYRPPYGRGEVVEPRRCIFAGTTNRSDYLSDDTGGRRFWPISVGQIDIAGLKNDRDQIWAEALAAYKAGEQWWLKQEEEATAAEIVAERQIEDPWSRSVLELVDEVTEVSTSKILDSMGIPIDRRSRADSMRIGSILTRAGWINEGRFKSGPYKDLTRYVRPGHQNLGGSSKPVSN